MNKVILFGTGRGAEVAYRHFQTDSAHEIYGFTVDKEYFGVKEHKGLPVVPFEDVQNHFPPNEFSLFILMGYEDMNGLRQAKFLSAKEKGYNCVSYVSSKVHSLDPVKVGENCFIMDNQTINFDVTIGNNVVMWSGNHVGDNTIIEDHVWLCSHVCIGGDSTIGEACFLGNNCTISNNVRIGSGCYVGPNVLMGNHADKDGVYVVPQAERSPMDSKRFMQLVHMHCEAR